MSKFQKILKASGGMTQQGEFEEGGSAKKLKQKRFDQLLTKGAVNHFCSANWVTAY